MNPIDPSKFSLDYLLENKVITIFSQDYVFEHGTDWDEVDITELIMNHLTYLCYCDDWGNPDYSRRFSGVLYQLYYGKPDLWYYMHIKDGLEDGVEVHFYDSGKVMNYMVSKNNRLVGKSYVWYENGKIDRINDWDQHEYVEFDENGEITAEGKLELIGQGNL